ncbi:MAG TPA: AEC family transporter [Terriglobia bacterium]|nr:AEC family transporter [Terriglobia bacterium]
MLTLVSILLTDIVPIFLIAAIGYLIGRRLQTGAQVLASLAFNVLSPCLIYTQIVTSSMTGADAGRMAAFCVLLTGSMGIAARIAAGGLKIEGKTRTGFLLTVMFSNSGNYALPVIFFAFGKEALSFASVYFVTSAIVVYTAGVFIAAHDGRNPLRTLAGILRVPALYALAAAFIVVITHTETPALLMRPIAMLSDGAIPLMILALGMQLQRATFPRRPAIVLTAVGLSLLLSPVIGTALASLLGLEGVGRNAAIVVSAMPAAVVTTVLALEFDLDANLVTSVVMLSTLLSPITIVLLIAYLQR